MFNIILFIWTCLWPILPKSVGKQYLHINFIYVVDVTLSLNTPLKFINFSLIFNNDCNTSYGIYFAIKALVI